MTYFPRRRIPRRHPAVDREARETEQVAQELFFVDDTEQCNHVIAHFRERKSIDPLRVNGCKLQGSRAQRIWDLFTERSRLRGEADGACQSHHGAIVEKRGVYRGRSGGVHASIGLC